MPDFKAFVRQQVEPLVLAPDRERKVVEEWAAQLEEAFDALSADGLSDDEAWRELHRQVPDWKALGVELHEAEPLLARMAKPHTREWLTTGLVRDLRASFRRLVKDRAFSLATILTLAICLGANAAIFTVVHAILLRPLPVPEAERIVAMGDVYPTITPNDILANDVPSYFDRLAGVSALDEQALFTFWFDTIVFDGVAEEVRGMRATPSLFPLLRVPPALGRVFAEAEGELGSERKVILSHGLWQRLYGGDPAVIGRSLRLGWTGHAYTIVGVMPPAFSFFDRGYDGHERTGGPGVQFWIPLALTSQQKSEAAYARYGFFHVGRLKPGATIEQVKAQIDPLNAGKFRRFPQFRLPELGMYTAVTPLRDALTRDVRHTLYLLWGGAVVVLLIGTINITNLALARARTRTRELATRLALGASRLHLRRQLVVEGLMPAAIGGAVALAVGWAILRVMASGALRHLPGASRVQVDWMVVGVIAGLSVLVGVLIGSVPATRALVPATALVDGGRFGTSGRAARLFGRGLVVSQVALSLVLLIGATLLMVSLQRLHRVDAGFSADRVTTATIFPPPSRYPDARAVDTLANRVLEAVRRLPGVRAAGVTSLIALSGFASPAVVSTTDGEPPPGEPALVPSVVAVTPGYFEAMATPLVRGRSFQETDRHDTRRVAIVDERLAARLWPQKDPIGQPIYRADARPYTIVGVVRDVKFEGLSAQTEVGTAYFPHAQAPPLPRLRWIAVKSAADAAAVVREVRLALNQIDPDLPLADIQTMEHRTARSLTPQRLATSLASLFGAVSLVLSVLGIYAVLTYTVTGRTREIGIRMALGSSVGGIFRLVLREGLVYIAAGLLLGAIGAIAMGRVLEGQLFGVGSRDPLVLGSVVIVTAAVALLACVAPAVRAARVDPVRVLAE